MTTFNFTISASFDADNKQDAWDEWCEWLTQPSHIEDGTVVSKPQAAPSRFDDLSIQPPYTPGEHWTVLGDLRISDDHETSDNYTIADSLRSSFPAIDFDPEHSCFFAYAKTEAEAQALVEAIKAWAEPEPNAWEALSPEAQASWLRGMAESVTRSTWCDECGEPLPADSLIGATHATTCSLYSDGQS